MDNFRPTIFVNAMIANRRDCSSEFLMQCSLNNSSDADIMNVFNHHFQEELWVGHRDENGHLVRATIGKEFKQGEGDTIIF